MDLIAFLIAATVLFFFSLPDFCLSVELYNAVPVCILSWLHISGVFIRNRPSHPVSLKFFSLCLKCLGSQMHNQQNIVCLTFFYIAWQYTSRSSLESMFPKHLQKSEARRHREQLNIKSLYLLCVPDQA